MPRNVDRLQKAMTAEGLQAMVATAAENVRYLRDYDTPALFIIGISGLAYIVDRAVTTQDIRTTGTYFVGRRQGPSRSPSEDRLQALRSSSRHHPNAEGSILAVLAEAGATRGRIDIDEHGISPACGVC